MSYILDALQRAEAERERHQPASALHSALSAQPQPEAQADTRRTAPPTQRVVLGLLAVVMVLLAVWAGWAVSESTTTPATPPAPVPVTSPTPAPVAAPPSTPPVSPLPAAPPAPPLLAPVPTPAPAATSPLRNLTELPAETQAQLPALRLSGATYAQNPALRMLIINGQVVHEGQAIAPGLLLESIGPRHAVLQHQGLRFKLPY
ncbi:MAG: hypothetical protein RLZZ352_2735 [Pseudomonadota bacterium]